VIPTPTESEVDLTGRLLDGRFEVRSCLGQGGFSTVYLAHDRHAQHEVALKILIERYRGRKERESRFFREAELLAAVAPIPGVVAILDHGRLEDLGGCPYLALEVVRGRSLREVLLFDGTPDLAGMLRWADQLARIGAGVHAAHVVHRDLTKANVFIADADDRVQLIDFSHASWIAEQDAPRLTTALEVPGTRGAMPPEQAWGLAASPSMDVFAFGVMLYELVAGRPPFAHVLDRQAYIELQREGKLRVSPLDPRVYGEIPSELLALVTDCTDNDARSRPSFVQVRAALSEIASSRAIDLEVAGVTPTREADATTNATSHTVRAVPLVVVDEKHAGHFSESPQEATAAPAGAPRPPTSPPARWQRVVVVGAALIALGLLAWWGGLDGPSPSTPSIRAVGATEPAEKEAVDTRTDDLASRDVQPPADEFTTASTTGQPTAGTDTRASEAAAGTDTGSPESAPVVKPRKSHPDPGPRGDPVASPRTPEPPPTTKPVPSAPDPASAQCQRQRQQAEQALLARRWAGVLSATRVAACWKRPADRADLRARALLKLERYAECAELEGSTSPQTASLLRLCRSKAEAAP
jgi:serine/threonine-protein kinase